MAINLPIVSKYDDSGIKAAEKALGGFGKIAAGVAAAATAAVAGVAIKSVQEFAKFDEALNKSVAIMGDVSDGMRNDMSDAARNVAKNTTFSADEAAESFFFLASAGLDAESSIAAMPQVAAFAQAGMFDMATATDLATDAQSALGLSSKDAEENLDNLTRVTDVFVKANTLANTSVEQLATAFTTKAGTALKTVGKDVEEGAAALALFADQGVKGELAGTQLTNTIFGLTDRALKAPEAFENLGISVFDAEGNMKNFAEIADDLGGAFEGMTEEQKLAELSNLGFSKQARAGVLMLSGQGDKIREYEDALREAGGTVEEVAEKQLMTPAAQFALLSSAMNDVAIEIGSVLGPALGDMAAALLPLIETMLPKITAFLEERVVPAVEKFSDVFIGGATGLADGSITIQGIFEDLFDKILGFFTGDGLKNLLEGFIEIRSAIIDALIKLIPMVVNVLVEMIPAIVETIADMLPTILEQAVETFNALVEAVVIVLPILLKALLDMLPDLINTIISLLPDIIDSAIELFTGLITALVEVIPDLLAAIIDAMPDIMKAIVDAVPQIIDAAFELFTGLVTALHDAWPDLIGGLAELFPKLWDSITEMVPEMIRLGGELIGGLVEGIIQDGPGLIASAVSSMGNSLINGVKGLFQIQSPSRVFMDIGSNVVQGLEEGITDNLRQLEDASLGMASTVTGTVESGMGNLSTPMPFTTPSAGGSGGNTIQITVNAGMGADGGDIGRQIVDEIIRFERSSGRVFVRA